MKERFDDLCTIDLPGAGQSYSFSVPAANLGEVLSPAHVTPRWPLEELVRRALREPIAADPLDASARPGAKILVVVDDVTRTTPAARIVPSVLECLHASGCRDEDITFAIALGTHRPMTPAEIEAKLGAAVASRYPVINTPAQARGEFVDTGEAWDGVPIEVHHAVLEADLVIGIGSVVPHADAGWSGGCKIILPGLCSERTVMENHVLGARLTENMLGRDETPIRRNMEGVVAKIGLDFVLNLVMTPYGEVIDVVGGHFIEAQRAAVRTARPIYSLPFTARADVVVSNAYPAELDLWQASKGIWSGELLTKPGGALIVNAPCPEGVGPHPDFLRLMQADPDDVLRRLDSGEIADRNMAGGAVPIGRMLRRVGMALVSSGLPDEAFDGGPIRHFTGLQETVDEYLASAGPGARLSVITHGGYTYPVQR